MTKENEGERSELPPVRVTRRKPRRSEPATYDEKSRRLMLLVAGMVLNPEVEPPAFLVAQAKATWLALYAAEFGDSLNIKQSPAEDITAKDYEDDTWPDVEQE